MDQFTQAYIEAALWSSTLPPFGECASCGKDAELCQFSKDGNVPEWTLCADCGGDPRGNHYEPPADDNYTVADIAPECKAQMTADCEKFQAENDCSESGLSQAGHDFWLTRNRHGCGFWDGDWPESGDKLTAACKAYGEVYLYVGDDGRIYC